MRVLILFLFLLIPIAEAKTVYLVPYPGTDPRNQFLNPFSSQDEFAKKWVRLRIELEKAGYTVKYTVDGKNLGEFTAILSVTDINPVLVANLRGYPKEKCLLLLMEPPTYKADLYDPALTKVFGKIFVMFDDLVDNKRYFKFHYAQPRQEVFAPILDFSQKKLAVMMAGNKDSKHSQSLYQARRDSIAFFSNLVDDEFDLYGNDWTGHAKSKGFCKSKWETYNQYKFSICYENMKNQVGYITEKIFDSMVGGSVPVYWGADNIADYIPKSCFIDRRDFSSDGELYLFLKTMKREEYEAYHMAIQAYFKSAQARLFSIDHFVDLIKGHIDQIDS